MDKDPKQAKQEEKQEAKISHEVARNPDERANENIKDEQAKQPSHDVGKEITDGEAG